MRDWKIEVKDNFKKIEVFLILFYVLNEFINLNYVCIIFSFFIFKIIVKNI